MSVTANIKMYRMGELGDCFLLRFDCDDSIAHVLIDCGSFRNGAESKARIKSVVANIQQQLGEHKLNAVVGTHQHNDHLSGFVHAEKEFKKMSIDQVWLSWLDNPDDQKAVKIGKEYNNLMTSLRAIRLKLNANPSLATDDIKESIDDILGFWGVNDKRSSLSGADKFPPELPVQAINILKSLGKEPVRYLNPGEMMDFPGLPAGQVKVYVLGPPKDEKQLKDITPNSHETYDPELTAANMEANKFLMALNVLSPTRTLDEKESTYPFDESESEEETEEMEMVWNKYYKSDKWRQIDEDWLNQAQRLALWMDSYTNNSSLVLAFELVKSNKVLLFAADAQTGNWSSWKEIIWKNTPEGFSWMNLIQKTVLYKVGHHGSHNATLVEGLNAMVHDELVAMIPVDKTDGNIKKKNGWKMPAKNLYKNLLQKTKNRVLLMDDGFAEGCSPDIVKSKCPWKKKGLSEPVINPLFIEYEIKG